MTLIALIVALAQVRQARADATAARKAVARERRLAFELALLAEIYDQWTITGTQHIRGHISALIVDPTSEKDIPLLRVATGTKSPWVSNELLSAYPRGSEIFNARVTQELDEAIRRRIEEK
ncbi:hypothetical protein [Microbacterium sp.]|uniref:hypothetical protein n=1 Tax=Microbacterium sp. TaxID=51671 RepID=UPI0025F30395|nr:hypothetical protein [Microbacterium sp.]MBT9608151.1 hypothetical protein [Microbacterium sp.]